MIIQALAKEPQNSSSPPPALNSLHNVPDLSEQVSRYVLENLHHGHIPLRYLEEIIESQPLLGMMIMDKSGWRMDHAARNQMIDIAQQAGRLFGDPFDLEVAMNNNALLLISYHEECRRAFEQQLYVYPFDERMEVLSYGVEHGFGLTTHEDFERGTKTVTTTLWRERMSQNIAEQLESEDYRISFYDITLKDGDRQTIHIWMVNDPDLHPDETKRFIINRYSSTVHWHE